MPKLPPRPCTYPRCKAYATNDGRCDEHQVRHRWNHTKNRHERGYDSKWVKLREKVLIRDEYLCQVCKANGIYTQAKEVDHIVPKALGGSDSFDNLQAICKHCHREKTLQEAKQAGAS